MDMKTTIGLVLRELRAQRASEGHAVSQQEIADCAQISVRYYHDLENGKRMPSLEVAERVARALGVSLGEFCVRIEEKILKNY